MDRPGRVVASWYQRSVNSRVRVRSLGFAPNSRFHLELRSQRSGSRPVAAIDCDYLASLVENSSTLSLSFSLLASIRLYRRTPPRCTRLNRRAS